MKIISPADGLLIDNFAGGGGASTGIEVAMSRPVDIAINHDEAAVAVHSANHPHTHHYCQSIFSVDPLDATGGKPVLLAWFSPDCKHHSKAKGGKPRDKNIRDMAWIVPHWIERLQKATPNGEGAPLVIMLENVEEFRDWGPLDDEGKPIKERKGEEFQLWVRRIRRLGYKVEYRELRACDYGAPTSRKRLFLIARRDGLPIVWPEPTHGAPDSVEVRTGQRLPWRTAAECIDWSIPCPSIFDRKRGDLKPATCKRIAAGVMRYVVNSAKPFIIPVTHAGGPNRVNNIDAPLPTVTAAHRGEMALVSPGIVPITHTKTVRQPTSVEQPVRTITTAKGGELAVTAASMVKLRRNSFGEDIATPLGTVTSGGLHHGVVSAFLHKYRPNSVGAPADGPIPTITANSFIKRGGGAAPISLACAHLEQANGGGVIGHDAREPVSTITITGSQQRLVETTLVEADTLPPELMAKAVRTAAFLVKYYGTGGDGEASQIQPVDRPLDTITAKARFAVVTVTIDAVTFVLVDIGMRMLEPRELANATGFPPTYILNPECWYRTDTGNLKYGRLPKAQQIAKIGNAVCPAMSEALARANLCGGEAERIAA
ncbi:MAG TPA: DNA cytosine methyltransferase [Sphingobium sp.]|uniref:DNA cytosine methyltransferase n=1 Tax=Sphingobium sp. TaxID=1912891 RepID=UPI002ED36189